MNSKKTANGRDTRVIQLHEELVEVEQRLIPTGLHVFGRASELQEKADLLRMGASFDRPEHGVRALPRLVAEALGVEGYDALLHETSASETRDLVDSIVSEVALTGVAITFRPFGPKRIKSSSRRNSTHQLTLSRGP
jgi:cobalamin biosynthesis Mg chelatase CobN